MGKKLKKGAAGGDFWDDEDMGEQLTAASPAPESAEGTPAPEDAEPADFLALIKQNKQKKDEKKNTEAPKLLLKKEKEKLKKEAEKQAKKEAAAKKKAADAEKKAAIKETNKKNAEAALAKNTPEPKDDADTPEPETKAAPKKKGKKAPAGLAALKKQLELKKQMEEEQRRMEEEEEAAAREEEERARKEEQDKEDARAAKRAAKKARDEQLKAEGKFLTKKQKEEKKLQERRRAALLAQGNVKIAALQKKEGTMPQKETKPEPKKVIKPKAFQLNKVQHKKEEPKKDEPEEVADLWEALADEDEPVVDDWETALDDEEEAEKKEEAEKLLEEQKARERAEAEAALRAQEEAKRKAAVEKAAAEKAALEEQARKRTQASGGASDKDLRSPICCILGHVDTGKTKLLDKIRQTNVQGGEAGGITQQIGATYFPMDAIKQKTAVMAKYEKQTFDVPGLLIIDTPGHESFTNLRSRGSSLCNIAILVIDIMHGLEQQTLELIRLLRDRKAPFIVALNKIDRLYGWELTANNAFRDSFAAQLELVQLEFQNRWDQIKLALAEQGLNSELYYENKNMAKYVSIVPTLAVTGEGVPDLLWLLLELTQKRMLKQLMYLSKVEATILEVKVVEGFGYTIDVVLSNGVLHEGDRVVLCGLNGPIATNIRALLTPPPARELRIKSEYVHHKEVKAALGVKIAANDLEKAVAGSRLLVVGPDDDEEEMMEEVMDDLTGLLDMVDTLGRGVVVQALTLGSLEALLDFLKDMKIPVMSIGLGPVYKRDVMKAVTMLDKAPELAVMLCFDVKVDREAEQYAEENKIKIFNADIIYHLFDAFTAYQAKLLEQRRKDFMEYAVMPCVLKTLQIINKRNPMIIGVDVMEGALKVGTPICAVRRDANGQPNIMVLGRVTSLEVAHKGVDLVKKGQTAQGVAMRLENPSLAQPVWGRHVDELDNLYSLITRRSIDTLKDPAFRDTVLRDDWLLIKKLKPVFDIK